jgi:putative membrane protein
MDVPLPPGFFVAALNEGAPFTDYLFRYGHYLGFLVLFASLVAEHLLTARSITGRQARTLARIDAIYGLSAVLVIVTGILMVCGYGFGKGTDFYLKNGVFHAKVTLFALVALLSLRPTLFFLRHRRAADDAAISVPRSIIMLQRVQLLLLLVLPLLGLLLARGVGFRG